VFFLVKPPVYRETEDIVVTGPNRNLLSGTSLSFRFAAPAGDVMMTGPMGLVEAARSKFSP